MGAEHQRMGGRRRDRQRAGETDRQISLDQACPGAEVEAKVKPGRRRVVHVDGGIHQQVPDIRRGQRRTRLQHQGRNGSRRRSRRRGPEEVGELPRIAVVVEKERRIAPVGRHDRRRQPHLRGRKDVARCVDPDIGRTAGRKLLDQGRISAERRRFAEVGRSDRDRANGRVVPIGGAVVDVGRVGAVGHRVVDGDDLQINRCRTAAQADAQVECRDAIDNEVIERVGAGLVEGEMKK